MLVVAVINVNFGGIFISDVGNAVGNFVGMGVKIFLKGFEVVDVARRIQALDLVIEEALGVGLVGALRLLVLHETRHHGAVIYRLLVNRQGVA